MLGGGGVGLVLHLEHDGDEFNSVRRLAEYKVALTARARVVVLFKVGVWEGHHSHRVELCQTVLLEALADHLCRLPRLEVLQPLYFLVANPQLVALPLYEGVFVQLALLCLKLKLGAQPIRLGSAVRELLFPILHRAYDSQLLRLLCSVELRAQLGQLLPAPFGSLALFPFAFLGFLSQLAFPLFGFLAQPALALRRLFLLLKLAL